MEPAAGYESAKGTPTLRGGTASQFERGGGGIDNDSTTEAPVLNRTAGLRDSWKG